MAQQAFLDDLRRYRVEYGWDWGVVHKVLCRRYGSRFTIAELKQLCPDEK